MIDTQLIMLEGLPSTGKSTNSDFLRMQLERNGKQVKWIHEVAHPHPTSFFFEACLCRNEYENFLRLYPKSSHTLNSIAVFRKNTIGIDLLEIEWDYTNSISEPVLNAIKQYDVWNFSLDEYEKAAIDKWEYFSETAMHDKDSVYILDSSIFQAQIFTFLWSNAPIKRLEKFVNRLCKIVRHMNPSLIYLYRENTEMTIDYLEKYRGTHGLENIWQRDKSRPYYQDKPEGADGFKHFLRDYANAARLLYDSFTCNKISIEISKANWASYENKMLLFLGVGNIQSPELSPPKGTYINDELNFTITVDNLIMMDPNKNRRKLTPKTNYEFYVEGLPIVLQFMNQSIVMSGVSICERWTKKGMVYDKKHQ